MIMNMQPAKARRWDLHLLMAALVIFNLPLCFGWIEARWMFFPKSSPYSAWWQTLTFAFIHVSWYHLLLDAAAFYFIYKGLAEQGEFRRLLYTAGAAAGTLILPLLFQSERLEQGLCGLSGPAHGLMAVSALELITRRSDTRESRQIGLWMLGVVCGKSLYEAISGHGLFEWLHFGLFAQPISLCHLGGVVGGMLMFACIQFSRAASSSSSKSRLSRQMSAWETARGRRGRACVRP